MNTVAPRWLDRLSPRVVEAVGGLGIAAATGAVIAQYGRWAGDSLPKLALAPLGGIFLLWFVINPPSIFLLTMLVRASTDKPFDSFKVGNSGFGAVFNAVVMLLVAYYVLSRPRRFFTFVLPIWAPFLLISAYGAYFTPDRDAAFKLFLGIASGMAVFTIPLCIDRKYLDTPKCIRLILYASVFPVLYGFVDLARGGLGGGRRIMSTFLHENIFAFFLSLTIALAFIYLKSPTIKAPPRTRLFIVLYMFVLLMMLGLTGTRSAWAATAFFFIVYGVVFNRRFLVALGIAGVLMLFLPPIQDRLRELMVHANYTTSASTNSYEWRLNMWRRGIESMRSVDYPLGKGLNSFFFNSLTFNPGIYHEGGAHNSYVQTLYELGIVGLVAASWLFSCVLVVLLKHFRYNRIESILFMAIVGMYLFFSYSDNMYYYLSFNWYFALIMGTICASILTESAKAKAAQPQAPPPFGRMSGALR